MTFLKKKLAGILAACMVMTGVFPASAEIVQEAEEITAVPEITEITEVTEVAESSSKADAVTAAATSSDAALLKEGSGEPVSYLDIRYDETSGTLKKETKTVSEYIVLTSKMMVLEAGKWYVAKGDVSIPVRVDNNGTAEAPARIILTDGCSFNAVKGISNPGDGVLIIYAQTEDPEEAGSLTISEPDGGDAGIGGDASYAEAHAGGNGGSLTICGGNIQVTGGAGAAGLGGGGGFNGKDFAGGNGGNGGNVTINGGKVTVKGGSRLITDIIGQGGAGIGGGSGGNAPLEDPDLVRDLSGGRGGDGGTVTINGGIVTAEGGDIDGAGIGGGGGGIGGSSIGPRTGDGGDGGDGATVTVNGGTVSAKGGRNGAAGIGGGNGERAGIRFADDTEIGDEGAGGNGGTVTINGGTVEAEGKSAAAIGSARKGNNHGTLTVDEEELGIIVNDSARNQRCISLAEYVSSRSDYVLIKSVPKIISFDEPDAVYVLYGTSIADAVNALPQKTTAKTDDYPEDTVLVDLGYPSDIASTIEEKYDPARSYDGTLDISITLTGTASGWPEEIQKTCSTEVPVTLHIVTKSLYTAVPCADTESGDYHETLAVSLDLSSRSAGTTYYYTKGSVKNGIISPTEDSIPYNAGDTIVFEESPDCQYLAAVAYENGVPSGIVTWYYTVRLPHTLTVNNGSGSGTYCLGDTVTVSADAPAGKVFGHWTVDKGDFLIDDPSEEVLSFTMPAEDVELTAWYEDAPLTYTVRFDMNGHGTQVPSQTVSEGGKAVKPADPAAAGFLFKGWYRDNGFTAAYDFGKTVTADTVIYAKWEQTAKKTYTILWKDWDGKELAKTTVEEGSLPKYPNTNPTRSGYNFKGWDKEITPAEADTVYTAVYGKKSSGGGGGTEVSVKKTQPTFSPNWYCDEQGVWRIRDNAGQTVVNAWLCDDVIAANGKNVWYLLTEDGAMLAGSLVQDNTGNCYSLETEHAGYYGMLRYQDGYYNCNGEAVFLTFNREHQGSFGAITNETGLEKLKAIYGVTKYNIGNESAVYTAGF